MSVALARRVVELPRLGPVELVASASALRALSFLAWSEPSTVAAPACAGAHPVLDRAERALRCYLDGDGLRDAPPVDLSFHPPFRRAVLEATAQLAPGATATYGAIAHTVGKPGAARAVGQALGANQAPIFIPCHRVLGAGGLGGFTPGVAIKRILLSVEGVPLQTALTDPAHEPTS